jgi:hypothetical protein
VKNQAGLQKLQRLRADFQSIVGRPFDHFFCPVLFRDDVTALSRAHIINTAFRGSDRTWTIQRADVDGFYGAFLESDFLAIQERGQHDPLDVLSDKELWRRLRPKILIDGREVEHYFAEGPVPPHFSQLIVETPDGRPVELALKLQPSETLAALQESWEIVIEKDMRVAALASLFKAAHLTWFELLGYLYALSAGGHFLGHDILGTFYLSSTGKSKAGIVQSAEPHFREFVNLVRPMASVPKDLKGTISDRTAYLCTGSSGPWAIATFIRTGPFTYAVLVPVLESVESAARFVRFLKEPAPRFEAQLVRYTGKIWEKSPASFTLNWPPANLV